MLGLANRGDVRVLPSLIAYFEDGWISLPAADAATRMLGLKEEPEGWEASEYLVALQKL